MKITLFLVTLLILISPGSQAQTTNTGGLMGDLFGNVRRALYNLQINSIAGRLQAADSRPMTVELTGDSALAIARTIYANEAGCNPDLVVLWARGEDFPSIGIGHSIWLQKKDSTWASRYFKADVAGDFPNLWKYIRSRYQSEAPSGAMKIPEWLNQDDIGFSPWSSRDDFMSAVNVPRVDELRRFLTQPFVAELQIDYIVRRLTDSLYKVVAASRYENRGKSLRVATNIDRLLSTQKGILALIDYVNFKGEGIEPDNDQNHSGLRQVLEGMNASQTLLFAEHPEMKRLDPGQMATESFALSAKLALARKVASVDDDIKREKYRKWFEGGWLARIEHTYRGGPTTSENCPALNFDQGAAIIANQKVVTP